MISILFPFVHLLIIKIIIQKVKTLLISQFASSSASSWGKYGDQSSSYHTPSHPSASPAPSYNPHGNLRRILRAHGWVIHRSMRFESHKLLCLCVWGFMFFFIGKLLLLFHILVWSPRIWLLVLMSPRAMSGQVRQVMILYMYSQSSGLDFK